MEQIPTVLRKSINEAIGRLKFNFICYFTCYFTIKIIQIEKTNDFFLFAILTGKSYATKAVFASYIIQLAIIASYCKIHELPLMQLIKKVLTRRFSGKQIITTLVVTLCSVEIPLIIINSIYSSQFGSWGSLILDICWFVTIYPMILSFTANLADNRNLLLK